MAPTEVTGPVPGPPTAAPARADLPAPTGKDVLWTLVGGVGGTGLGTVVGAVPSLLLGGPRHVAVALATAAVGGVVGLWLALVRRRGWGRRELGFVSGTRSLWHLLWEVPLALVAGLVGTTTIGTLVGLTPDAGAGQDAVTDGFTASGWSLVVAALCVVLLLPVVEEVVFRRVVLGWLRTRVPTVLAVALVSVLFGAVHVAPVAVLYLSFLGVSTAVLLLAHRTLWAPVALHATNNALASLVAVLALTA